MDESELQNKEVDQLRAGIINTRQSITNNVVMLTFFVYISFENHPAFHFYSH